MSIAWKAESKTLADLLAESARHQKALATDAARHDEADYSEAKARVQRGSMGEMEYYSEVARVAQTIKAERLAG